MTIIFSIIDFVSDQVVWKLRHNPSWEIPFVTLAGTQHIWNWDFISGNLLQDGVPLTGYTIMIEKEDAPV